MRTRRQESEAWNARLNAMHRRAQAAEAIAARSLEQLRNEGQRNLGRALANCAAVMYEGRWLEALAVLRLVPRGPGDHVAGCPAGIRTPQGGPPPIGQGACSCHVDEVRRVLGEVT